MKENLRTVQLRGTIFIQQNIGYTAEVSARFKERLLPDGKILGVPQPGVPFNGQNPNIPQYGMSWRILNKEANGAEYNIIFNPGKVDIVYNRESPYGGDVEEQFCKFCIEKFGSILDILHDTNVQRIAYAPLYGIIGNEQNNLLEIWGKLLKKTIYDGVTLQDINLSFLLKQEMIFGGRTIQMNLLHSFFDGFQTQVVEGQQKVNKTIMFQLDLNSIPDPPLDLDKGGVSAFFDNILSTKYSLVDNVIPE